jgi:hypothetical protein
MPEAAWRCSHCGTMNAPATNACRTCGHWPSLFDLESSTVESQPQPASQREEPDVYRPEAVDLESPAPEPVTVDAPDAELRSELAEDEETESKPGWRRFVRLVVPIGVAIYVLVTMLANR